MSLTQQIEQTPDEKRSLEAEQIKQAITLKRSLEAKQIKQTIALKRAIEQRLNQLVLNAIALVDRTGVAATGSKMQKNQFDNLLAVAEETGSVEVVKNFIRYQIGRKGDLGWRHGGFGLELIKEIDEFKTKQADEVAQASGVELDLAWMELVRLYIGYMRRHWVYENDRNGNSQKGGNAP